MKAVSKTTPVALDLSKVPLFAGLTPKELDEARQASRRRAVPDGGYFFMQGDLAISIFVLESGKVKLSQLTLDGQQVLMGVIGPGTLFGGVAMARAEVYPVNAQAAEDSTALFWHKLDIMGLVGRIPALALNALQVMAAHVEEFHQRYRELATERVERRLARALLRLASQAGRKVEDGVLIDLPLSRQDLAEMTATTLFTVSRTLSQWEQQGLVVAGRERVVIRYPHGLVSIAEDLPKT